MPGLENEKPRKSCFCFSALPLNPEVTFFRSWLFSWRVRGLGKKELRFQLKDIYSVALLGDFFLSSFEFCCFEPKIKTRRSRESNLSNFLWIYFRSFGALFDFGGTFFYRARFSWRREAKKKSIFSIEGWPARRKGDLINDCLLI